LPTYGRAGLLFAAYFGYLSCLIYLLEVFFSSSEIRELIRNKTPEFVEDLREPKLVSSRDPRGRTALHLASWRGHYQCVEYLMEKGVELEAADDEGATALMYAVKEANSVHIVEYLLNSGADVSRKDCNNNTALHHCCLSKNEDCGKVLANHLAKSDPKREICNATNNNGET
uniref:ANK_REP_REGION domain-containing protein n=1 Tax=Haemonchus placei TaxID=6290 RepID=A0A0N4VZB8_HAEPC